MGVSWPLVGSCPRRRAGWLTLGRAIALKLQSSMVVEERLGAVAVPFMKLFLGSPLARSMDIYALLSRARCSRLNMACIRLHYATWSYLSPVWRNPSYRVISF